MALYDASIATYLYKYQRQVYFTSQFSTFKSVIVAKLVLTSSNFNFDLANSDGSDFRLIEQRAGTGTLKMWIAYWSASAQYAVLFFHIPDVDAGESLTFNAWWGYEDAADISDPSVMEFLFYDNFNSTPLDGAKWTGNTSNTQDAYGYYLAANTDFTTITDPLYNKNSWILEVGIYCDFDDTSTWDQNDWAVRFDFEGTENDFFVLFNSPDRFRHNLTEPGGTTTESVIQSQYGLEGYSYQEIYIDYYEPNDAVTVKLLNRNTWADIEETIPRKVEGDTRPKNIKVYGYKSSVSYDGANPSYLSWLALREYDGTSTSEMDGSNLYIADEYVPPQTQDFREYLADITSVAYKHESSFGGDASKLSDEGYSSDADVWISDDDATLESQVELIIHTGWLDNVASSSYLHYDSGHTYYYNAAKLSDSDTDFMSRDYWQCTTTSGWAAIKFVPTERIGSFRIKATGDLTACPKDYTFYGSNVNPYTYFTETNTLISGTFYQTEDWQMVILNNNAYYRYYILYIHNTYGGSDIEIQEWEMLPFTGSRKKYYPSQLRLHPALYDDWEYNFPKEISLQGSVDGDTWDTLIPWISTYTPFMEHYTGYGYWQRYSFINTTGYWSFKLLVRGNWGASDNKIIIGEWSIHELASEAYTSRILGGTTNKIQQIWTTDDCGLDSSYGIIFIANEKLNKVSDNQLVEEENLPSYYEDFNVV